MNRRSLMATAIATFVGTALGGCGGGGDGSLPLTSVNLTGSVAPPLRSWWAPPGLAANTWHWTATNPSGSVMLATAIPGGVFLSRDYGVSWKACAGLPG